MRWALVILILYILPVLILFKYRGDFKRSSIYGSIYVVVASVIVITNIYISTLNKIESMLESRNYASDEKHIDKEEYEHIKKECKDKNYDDQETSNTDIDSKELNEINKETSKTISSEKSDDEVIKKFKESIYEIERKALIPMRECIPNFKNMDINLKAIKKAKKDVSYAKEMCDQVVETYEQMEVPKLSNIEDTKKLESSKVYVQKAYILRGKAMDSAQNLLKSKNMKYVGEIKEYLRLSDIEIKNFLDTIKEL